MRRQWWQRLAFCAVCACMPFAAGSFAAEKPVVRTVLIDGTAFSPNTMTVKRGDTILWVNKDPFPHTATAMDGTFDSKSIDAGKSWRYVASKPGDYTYTCTFHPTMKA